MTAWFTFSSTIIASSALGKIGTAILRSCPDIKPCSLRISVCTWKWPLSCKLYNFWNRWCGVYWASKGIWVIPTVNWGDESTFDFCFDGIEKGSVVAVSIYMASAYDNR